MKNRTRASYMYFPGLLLVLMLALPINSFAMTCPEPDSLAKEVEQTEIIFLGQVWGVKFVEAGMQVDMIVERSWKGVEDIRVSVVSNSQDYRFFQLQDYYIVFASKVKGKFVVAPCSRTKSVVSGKRGQLKRELTDILGKPKEWEYPTFREF